MANKEAAETRGRRGGGTAAQWKTRGEEQILGRSFDPFPFFLRLSGGLNFQSRVDHLDVALFA